MALNYSRRPVSPTLSEDKRIVNGYIMEGLSAKNGEGYSGPWHMSSRVEANERNFSYGRDRVDCCSSSESTSTDIVDLLPSDPFGMDIKTTFTAITGWLEDLEADCGGYIRSNNWATSQQDYGLFSGWNLIWNSSLKHQPFPCSIQLKEKLNMGTQPFARNTDVNETSNTYPPSRVNAYGDVDGRGMGTVLAPYDIGQLACNMGGFVDFSNGGVGCSAERQPMENLESGMDFDGAPHEALYYVLGYLGVQDLLSMERVCSSLSSAVRGDPLIWKAIHVDQPLNERITDDALVHLAGRAQGRLECLSLVECPKVTDDGLRRVLDTNRRLTKFSVPGCTRITIECIVNSIRAYNSNNEFGGIKYLRIGGLYGVNHEHFAELNLLLGSDNKKIESHHMPNFYHRGHFYLPYDDDRAMDIEMCPRCEKLRLVYDCPAEGCKVKGKSPLCRACILCIGRCAECGRCINDTEFEETFCLELLCSDCFKQLHNYQDKLDKNVHSGARRGTNYQLRLHG